MLGKPSNEEKKVFDTLKIVEGKVDRLIAETAEAINTLEAQRVENDKNIEDAKEAMQQAEDNIDAVAYSVAKAKLDTYMVQGAMLNKALEKRRSELAISEKEVFSLVRETNIAVRNIAEETDKRLAEKSREMRNEAIDLYKAVVKANHIIMKIKSGLDHREDRLKNYSAENANDTITWATAGMNTNKYAEYDDMTKYPQGFFGRRNFFNQVD